MLYVIPIKIHVVCPWCLYQFGRHSIADCRLVVISLFFKVHLLEIQFSPPPTLSCANTDLRCARLCTSTYHAMQAVCAADANVELAVRETPPTGLNCTSRPVRTCNNRTGMAVRRLQVLLVCVFPVSCRGHEALPCSALPTSPSRCLNLALWCIHLPVLSHVTVATAGTYTT